MSRLSRFIHFYTDEDDGNGKEEPYILKTVKAAIVHITDALAKPAVSVKAYVEPVQSGSGDPSPDNVRPISGWTGCKVFARNENLFDGEWELGVVNTSTGQNSPSNSDIRTKNMIAVKGGENVYMSWDTQSLYMLIVAYKTDGSYSRYVGARSGSSSTYFPINADEGYFRLYIYGQTTAPTNMEMKRGSAVTDFVPYSGTTIPITFPDAAGTVYGGEIDVTGGKLRVTYALGIITGANTEPWSMGSFSNFRLPISGMLHVDGSVVGIINCDKLKPISYYDRGSTSAPCILNADTNYLELRNMGVLGITSVDDLRIWLTSNNVSFVYPLATPIEFDLTPQQIQMLLGENNVWCDATGSEVEVQYKASAS